MTLHVPPWLPILLGAVLASSMGTNAILLIVLVVIRGGKSALAALQGAVESSSRHVMSATAGVQTAEEAALRAAADAQSAKASADEMGRQLRAGREELKRERIASSPGLR